jgi:proteic killer suppression protein
MIQNFLNIGTEDIFNGKNTKNARKTLPSSMRNVATRKLDQLDSIIALEELRVLPGNRLEALVGSRKGQFSIRNNDQYRICFRWKESGPYDVEITDYH